MKGADNERENEVVVLVCCRCALTPKKLSWAYAGATPPQEIRVCVWCSYVLIRFGFEANFLGTCSG